MRYENTIVKPTALVSRTSSVVTLSHSLLHGSTSTPSRIPYLSTYLPFTLSLLLLSGLLPAGCSVCFPCLTLTRHHRVPFFCHIVMRDAGCCGESSDEPENQHFFRFAHCKLVSRSHHVSTKQFQYAGLSVQTKVLALSTKYEYTDAKRVRTSPEKKQGG